MVMLTMLQRYATWKNTIILLAVQFVVQAIILFLIYPTIGGQGVPLDMRSDMSIHEIQAYLMSIGEKGRRLYALNEGTADILFPLLYSSAYSFLFIRLITPMAGTASRWHWFALLPFSIAIADVIENASIIGSLSTYQHPGSWFRAVVVFNTVKGSLMMITIASLLSILCARLLFLLFKKRRTVA
jgi:hypothetical protein